MLIFARKCFFEAFEVNFENKKFILEAFRFISVKRGSFGAFEVTIKQKNVLFGAYNVNFCNKMFILEL